MSESEREEEIQTIRKHSRRKRQRSEERKPISVERADDEVIPAPRRQKVYEQTDPVDEMWTIGVRGSSEPDNVDLSKMTSYALMRDAMDSLGRGSKAQRMIMQSIPVLSQKTFQTNDSMIDEHMTELEHSSLFDIATRKIWTSVCPDCIDTMLIEGPVSRRPTKWFSEYVINTVWAEELRKAMWSIMAVGYYAVTYSTAPDQGGALSPTVLDPREYKLWWTMDQSGRRYPWITPRTLPISPLYRTLSTTVTSHPTYGIDLVSMTSRSSESPLFSGFRQCANALFEAADVYVETYPSETGEIRSRARACLREILFLEQLQYDVMLQSNHRTNVPLVTQFDKVDFTDRVTYGMGEGRVPTSVYGDPRAASSSRGPAATNRAKMADPISRAEDAIGIQMWEHAARSSAASVVSGRTVKVAVAEASAAAAVAPLRLFNVDSGRIIKGKALQPWERAHLPLPPGCTLGTMQLPDVPKITMEFMDRLTSFVFSTLGFPPELVLGTGGSRSHVSTSPLTQEALRSVVRSWRTLLTRRAELMYWRIFGDSTISHLAQIADRAEIEMTKDIAEETVMDISFKFNFRNERLGLPEALALYDSGWITREETIRTIMTTYGLSETAFELQDPLRQSAKKPDVGRTSIDGTNPDVGGTGFSDNKPPAPATVSKVSV